MSLKPVLKIAVISVLVSAGIALSPVVGAQQSEDSLRGKSAQQILNCAKNKACNSQYDYFSLADALSKPRNVPFLIHLYPKADAYEKQIIVLALYPLKGPRVLAFMRGIAFENLKPNQPDYAPGYYPLQYLAKRCDGRALARLSRSANIEKGYPIACMQWQYTVKTFGNCEYRPAIPYLIEALDTACLNIDDNAFEALKKLLPGAGACEEKKSLEATQKCYRQFARSHGYKTFN